MSEKEKLPLWEQYKVIDYVTIFKSEKWWEAIVVIESFGRRSIAMYLWQKRNDGTWRRQHKFQVRNIDEWNKLKNAVEQLMPKLQTETPKLEPSPATSS
ncbi:MAG: hypothetical protein QXM22_03300 [Candidatus Bathyarchaeia archaeon]